MRLLIASALALVLVSPADAVEISNFRAGLACTHSSPAQSGRGWICHVTEDIPVTDQGRCVFNGEEQPCTWYGFEFDYRDARAGDALQCVFSQSEPGTVGNPEGILAESATGQAFDLVLEETAGHVFNPQYHTFVARPPGSAPLTIRGACSFEAKPVFEYTFHLRFPELPPGGTGLRQFTQTHPAPRDKATTRDGKTATIIAAPAPVYPPDLARSGIGGTTQLHIRLDATGAVVDVSVAESAGHPQLDASAVETARTWRFRPAEDADGVAIASKIKVPVTFDPPLTAAHAVHKSFEFDGKDPSIISAPAPRYPPALVVSRIGGTTRLRVALDAEGAVADVGIAESAGHSLLDNAAMQAARTWRFRPAEDSEGTPVPSVIEVPVSFEPPR